MGPNSSDEQISRDEWLARLPELVAAVGAVLVLERELGDRLALVVPGTEFSGVVASVPVRAERRPAGTGCSDLLHRAGLAFAIAELAYRNGWPRGGLPMLLGAVRLGLQALLEQLTGREPTSRSLIVLLEVLRQQPAVPTGITENLQAIELPLWEALDKVDMAAQTGGYYELSSQEIGRLTIHIGHLLKVITRCLFEP